jgi:hypothetical protein
MNPERGGLNLEESKNTITGHGRKRILKLVRNCSLNIIVKIYERVDVCKAESVVFTAFI